ncbi:MAG: glucodextranase DOMON-like domain-containing protein [Anaerolineae bacterium]|jgi:alpha-amylase/alpha-mannosidase (GH57 family)
MRRYVGLWNLLLILGLLLAACGAEAPTPTAEPRATATLSGPEPTAEATAPEPEVEGEPLYLALIWHQHQPVYFKDPETGLYQKPWVRLHAAKDYVDMAAILQDYPGIQATFNLTPSLLRQLQDLEAGAQDTYEVYTQVPADQLTDQQKVFIQARFFDINPKIIARFPRYQEIAGDRANWESWDAGTWRDLQILFNLGWTDPDWLDEEPLKSLVDKGRDFGEEDKSIVLDAHARLVAEVIPLHKRLQDEGRIEVTTTPFFHPILPLLLDSNLASVAVPDIELPPRYTYGFDAVAQIQMGIEYYTELFGQSPRGMWPAEGAVAQEIVGMIAREGIIWMASDEEVLARSQGSTGFGRNAQETVQEADTLYRPYIVSSRDNAMYIVFRDKVISDKVGFTYSGTPGVVAAQDLVDRLLAIRDRMAQQGATGPNLVSIILDGENAWEHYDNDGKEFLNAMYRLLEEEQAKGTLQTITPTGYVEQFPEQQELDNLWPGSWVSPDYLTWIGEDEENRAWDYLGQVRGFVERKKHTWDGGTLAAVMDAIYAAEGSDWFWWYGSDQNSGDDGSFDEQFRRTLQRVYEIVGEPVPTFLKVPVIPQETQPPEAGATALIKPEIDGVVAEGEWQGAGYYVEEGGAQATPSQIVSQLWYGFDTDNLYLRLDARRPWVDVGDEIRIGFYLTRPGGGPEIPFSRIGGEETLLGFSAQALVEATIAGDSSMATLHVVSEDGGYQEVATGLPVGVSGSTLEVAVPYVELGKPDAGDAFRLRVVVSEGEQRDIQTVPTAGPAAVVVPDLGLTTPVLTVQDPEGDDHGPGTYAYPLDPVFGAGAYDILEFAVAEDDNNLIFRMTFAGPLNNDWGAPNGLGIHTVDVYIDAAEGGERKLLPGRNAALPEGSGWEFAIWAEGWTPGLYGPPAGESPSPVQLGDSGTLNIASDPGQSKITIRMSKDVLAQSLGVEASDLDPASWGYLGVVMSQEGYPASGVWRVRDVGPSPEQWRLGGAPADTNHTRIIDVAYPPDMRPAQEEALSSYPASQESDMDALGPDDFAQLPLVTP